MGFTDDAEVLLDQLTLTGGTVKDWTTGKPRPRRRRPKTKAESIGADRPLKEAAVDWTKPDRPLYWVIGPATKIPDMFGNLVTAPKWLYGVSISAGSTIGGYWSKAARTLKDAMKAAGGRAVWPGESAPKSKQDSPAWKKSRLW